MNVQEAQQQAAAAAADLAYCQDDALWLLSQLGEGVISSEEFRAAVSSITLIDSDAAWVAHELARKLG